MKPKGEIVVVDGKRMTWAEARRLGQLCKNLKPVTDAQVEEYQQEQGGKPQKDDL